MKIFTREQIYEADQATIAKEDIPSINLMERAGGYAFQWIHERLKGQPVPVKVFCGIGNNGGDGLVIARYLIEHNYNVETYIVNYSDKRSEDFLKAYDALKEKTKNWPVTIKSEDDFPDFSEKDLIVDAVFGIGFNRPAAKWVQSLFNTINEANAFVLSIDIASGMYTDKVPRDSDVVIKPTIILTFQAPKLIFFLPQTGKYIKDWDVLDIGLDREYLMTTETQAKLINKEVARQLYRPRDKFTHKGVYGHSLIAGGSYGKMGSIVLSTHACLKAGSGLVTSYIPQHALSILQTSVPEAMVLTDKQNGKYLEEIEIDIEPTAIGIGMGMGTEPQTCKAFGAFLQNNKKPLVIDADGLNILSKSPKFLFHLPNQTILTPHPKELERLIGPWEDDFDKLEKTAEFAKQHDVIIVLKGAYTFTVYDRKYYINTTGNPGLATGGTGDVLTGIITGLLSQGYDPLSAAVFGVYLQGKSGDLAINHTGYEALTAGDVVSFIGQAFLDLFKQPENRPEQ